MTSTTKYDDIKTEDEFAESETVHGFGQKMNGLGRRARKGGEQASLLSIWWWVRAAAR